MSGLIQVEWVGPFGSASLEWTVAKQHKLTRGPHKGDVLSPGDTVFTKKKYDPDTKHILEEDLKIYYMFETVSRSGPRVPPAICFPKDK